MQGLTFCTSEFEAIHRMSSFATLSSEFRPHPLFRNGHTQTLVASLFFSTRIQETATQHRVPLCDGDQLVLHDDRPADWSPGDGAVLMIHGLAGNHQSKYMQRIASKLNALGVRTFRMDLRGCGAGLALARHPYHSGRSDDALAALGAIQHLCPDSPLAIVGFSLGGNITLKLLGEAPEGVPSAIRAAVAVNPPIDLQACVDRLHTGLSRWYDRYFVKQVLRQIADRLRVVPDALTTDLSIAPRGMRELDERFTAPLCGFGSAENYYRQCSSGQFLPAIQVPTLVLASLDDPLVPGGPFQTVPVSQDVTIRLSRHGGHLGFLCGPRTMPDRYWMDWQVVDWIVRSGVVRRQCAHGSLVAVS